MGVSLRFFVDDHRRAGDGSGIPLEEEDVAESTVTYLEPSITELRGGGAHFEILT